HLLRSSKIFFAASLLVIVLSFFVRVLLIERRPLTGIEPGIGHQDNEDAATHVLVTETAFGQVSWQEHKFLPLFTYGATHKRWVDDLPTASRFSEAGYNYYTSFPPLGFVAPY